MLWKCCTQYVSKFGKLSSGHRTGKAQFSLQSQGRAMPKNVPAIVQLCSFCMLVRLRSKSFKLGFSTWTENFQIYKLGLEKAEDQRSNCQHLLNQREIRASLLAQMVKSPPVMWETWVQSLDWEDRLEDGGWQESLACCSPWGHKESDTTGRLNNNTNSAYKSNKQGHSIQPWRTPFPSLSLSIVPRPVLIVASWPAYRFLRRHVGWSGISISLRISHSLLWSAESKALAYSMKQMFFWNSLAFSMFQQMLAIWSLILLPFLNPTCTSGSSGFTYC